MVQMSRIDNILFLYVNDLLVTRINEIEPTRFKASMMNEFLNSIPRKWIF